MLLRIRAVLKSKKMKQQELADRLGVSKVTVSYWCNNQTIPSLETLSQIARILEVKIANLIED